MVYDPQRNRRRPHPAADETAPVEAILDHEDPAPPGVDATGGEPAEPTPTQRREPAERAPVGPVLEDPPPVPSVTPEPADPWSDELLFGTGLSGVAALAVVLLVLRWLWLRRRRRAE